MNMNNVATLSSWIEASNLKTMAGPLLIIMILAMMVLPLPPFVLDLFLLSILRYPLLF